MTRAALSVVMPNYNHGRYIGEALGAIVEQTYVPMEIIIVDDASTDDSVEVIENFMKRYRNIRLLRNTSNQGAFYSANRARSEAHCEYIYVGAADDKVLPGFFERCIELLARYPQAGLCAAYPKFIDSQGNYISREELPSFHSHEAHSDIRTPRFLSAGEMLSRLSRQPWFLGGVASVVFRRSALAEAGGQVPELGLLADWFAVHYVALKYGICYIPEALVAFRMLPNSLGASIIQHPKVAMANHARALLLMQESRYRDVFCKAFIDSKRREFTYTSFRGALVNQQSYLLRELSSLVPPRGTLDKAVMRLLRNLMRFQQMVLKVYCYRNVGQGLKEKM